jgi:hypothetical protein
MNLEEFKRRFDEVMANVTTKELMGDLIMRGAKLQRIYDTTHMTNKEKELEDFKQVAFDTISDLYFEGHIPRHDWDEATDKIEECTTEIELRELVTHYEKL